MSDLAKMTDEELSAEAGRLRAERAALEAAIVELQKPKEPAADGFDLSSVDDVIRFLEVRPVDGEAIQRARRRLVQNNARLADVQNELRGRHKRAAVAAAAADLRARRALLEEAATAIEGHSSVAGSWGAPAWVPLAAAIDIRNAIARLDKAFPGGV